MVKEPEHFLGKKIFISGGGDSALDWAIYFAEHNNSSVGLVHRSKSFRAHKDSEKVHLQEAGKIEFYTHAEVVGLKKVRINYLLSKSSKKTKKIELLM